MTQQTPVRVRFAPSPTGYLHIGGRTALFNWLLARKTGGVFVVRIEDTDTARNVEGADQKIVTDLRWLGLDWNEGIEVGGPNAPYYQSQRMANYESAVEQLLAAGRAYYAFDTADELDAMREQAQAAKRTFLYPRPERFPSSDEVEAARQEGRPVVVRFVMPDRDITVHDEVMGDVTVGAGELDDFIIRKANGMPTYHLANVVDDGAMKINMVMRGQEFLSQTPRHIALQEALGLPTPGYAHMPLIMDMKGRKLSKRDGDVEVFAFRKAGYLPEALVNFIALLGWSPSGDREKFTLDELVAEFSVDRIGRANCKFDRDKLLAFNTDAAAQVAPDRLRSAFGDWLSVNPDSPLGRAGLDEAAQQAVLEACQGFRTFADIETKAGFLYVDDSEIEYDPKAVKKVLAKGENAGFAMLDMLLPMLEAVDPWTAETLEKLIHDVTESQGGKMGLVAQPIRVAVSGTTVSPSIVETLIMLGKAKTLNRIHRALTLRE